MKRSYYNLLNRFEECPKNSQDQPHLKVGGITFRSYSYVFKNSYLIFKIHSPEVIFHSVLLEIKLKKWTLEPASIFVSALSVGWFSCCNTALQYFIHNHIQNANTRPKLLF